MLQSQKRKGKPARSQRILAAMLITLVVGCASGPEYKDIGSEIAPIEPGKGRVFFYRPQMSFLYVGAVTLNGEEIRVPSAGGFEFVDKKPGEYEVLVDAVTNESTSFLLEDGKEVYIRITVDVGGWTLYTISPQITDRETAVQELQELNYTGHPDNDK